MFGKRVKKNLLCNSMPSPYKVRPRSLSSRCATVNTTLSSQCSGGCGPGFHLGAQLPQGVWICRPDGEVSQRPVACSKGRASQAGCLSCVQRVCKHAPSHLPCAVHTHIIRAHTHTHSHMHTHMHAPSQVLDDIAHFHIRQLLINSLSAFIRVKCLRSHELGAQEEFIVGKVRGLCLCGS